MILAQLFIFFLLAFLTGFPEYFRFGQPAAGRPPARSYQLAPAVSRLSDFELWPGSIYLQCTVEVSAASSHAAYTYGCICIRLKFSNCPLTSLCFRNPLCLFWSDLWYAYKLVAISTFTRPPQLAGGSVKPAGPAGCLTLAPALAPEPGPPQAAGLRKPCFLNSNSI